MLVKTKLNDCPGERVEELNKLPESNVTVWVIESSLIHVTFVPVLIFSVDGLNEKFLISIVTFDSIVVVFEVTVVDVVVVVVCEGVVTADVWEVSTGVTFDLLLEVTK